MQSWHPTHLRENEASEPEPAGTSGRERTGVPGGATSEKPPSNILSFSAAIAAAAAEAADHPRKPLLFISI